MTSVVSGRHLSLLVIDDQNTDWSKYFRGKRIGDYEIKVEQAEFRELTITATSDGANVSMAVYRGGTRVGRSFRPDFLLVSIFFYLQFFMYHAILAHPKDKFVKFEIKFLALFSSDLTSILQTCKQIGIYPRFNKEHNILCLCRVFCHSLFIVGFSFIMTKSNKQYPFCIKR